METTIGAITLFAVLLPKPSFDVGHPAVIGLTVLTLGILVLAAINVRRSALRAENKNQARGRA